MNFWQLTKCSCGNQRHIQFLKFTGWTILEFTGWTFFDNSRAEQYWNEGLNNIFTGCIFVWKFTDCFYIDGLNNLWNSRANSRAVYSRAAFKVGNSRANSWAVFTVEHSRANSRGCMFTGCIYRLGCTYLDNSWTGEIFSYKSAEDRDHPWMQDRWVLLGQFVSSRTAMPRKSCRLDEEVFEFRIDRLKRMQMLLQHWDRDRWNSWSQSSWWTFEVWFSMFWHTSDRYTIQIIFYDDDMMFRYV